MFVSTEREREGYCKIFVSRKRDRVRYLSPEREGQGNTFVSKERGRIRCLFPERGAG